MQPSWFSPSWACYSWQLCRFVHEEEWGVWVHSKRGRTAVSQSAAGAAHSFLCLGRSSFQKTEDILGKCEDSRVVQNMWVRRRDYEDLFLKSDTVKESFLMSVPECVSCWTGRAWRGQGTCKCRVLSPLELTLLPSTAFNSWITDEEGVAAGYTLYFNVWMPCCCSKGCVLSVCLFAHSLGTAHEICLILSLLTHHTASPEMRYRRVNARENFLFQTL